MSRKRLRSNEDEIREWQESQERRRESARQISEQQRQRMIPPGFRRLVLEEEIPGRL